MEDNKNESLGNEKEISKEKNNDRKDEKDEIIIKEKNNNSEKKENVVKEIENNDNIIDNILNQENNKIKEKEKKKLEKQERKKNFLSKKHKSAEEIENEKIFQENNKILINFLGDSITEGLKWQKKEVYCHYLSKWLNIRINNQGYRATKIARQKDDNKDFNYRLKDLDDKADFTFIFGGTNDYSLGDAELGDINSESYFTFYGALKNLVKDLLKKFDNDKICFILPLSRFDEDKVINHGNLPQYRNIIKEICDLNKIDYLDLCDELPVPNTDGKSEYFKDGLHPNKQGHKLIARNIIKYLKKKGIINNKFEYKE